MKLDSIIFLACMIGLYYITITAVRNTDKAWQSGCVHAVENTQNDVTFGLAEKWCFEEGKK